MMLPKGHLHIQPTQLLRFPSAHLILFTNRLFFSFDWILRFIFVPMILYATYNIQYTCIWRKKRPFSVCIYHKMQLCHVRELRDMIHVLKCDKMLDEVKSWSLASRLILTDRFSFVILLSLSNSGIAQWKRSTNNSKLIKAEQQTFLVSCVQKIKTFQYHPL